MSKQKQKAVNKAVIGTVACVIAVITILASVIGIVSSKKSGAVQAVSLGVGQVYKCDEKKHTLFSKSEDENVACLNENGEIVAVGVGECVVKLGTKKLDVTVYDAPESIAFAQKELLLCVGETAENPAAAQNVEFIFGDIYSNSNEEAASIDENGKITALSPGEAVITASTYNGLSDECKITVKKAPEKVWFASECKELVVGRKHDLKPRIEDDCASSVMDVTSSDESVIRVNEDGSIEALKTGSATITVTVFGGVKAECTVNAVDAPPPRPTEPYVRPSGEVKYADCVRKDLDPSRPMIAFTFDDGPNASTTNRILDALEANDGSATFFLVGNRTKSGGNRAAVQRMVQMGCQLGNHTYDHEHYGKNVTASDIGKCNEAVIEATGYAPSAFRPTGGSLSDTIKKNAGVPIYIWSLDTLDWKTRDANSTYNKILNNAQDGDIVLMHDIYKPTAEAVERVLPELVSRGYQIVNIAELEYYKGKTPSNGSVYYSYK